MRPQAQFGFVTPPSVFMVSPIATLRAFPPVPSRRGRPAGPLPPPSSSRKDLACRAQAFAFCRQQTPDPLEAGPRYARRARAVQGEQIGGAPAQTFRLRKWTH